MRILANENFPGCAVEALRARGHDVTWVRTDAPGISDEQVLEWAHKEKRTIITFDKDFGELAFRAYMSGIYGVILFRVVLRSPSEFAEFAARVLETRSDWEENFSVVEKTRIRIRPIERR